MPHGDGVGIDPVGIKNDLGVQISPATETSLAKLVGLELGAYDYVSHNWNAGTFTSTWVLKTGGSGGSTVATVVIVYDDADKSNVSTVTKT